QRMQRVRPSLRPDPKDRSSLPRTDRFPSDPRSIASPVWLKHWPAAPDKLELMTRPARILPRKPGLRPSHDQASIRSRIMGISKQDTECAEPAAWLNYGGRHRDTERKNM